MAHPVRRLTWLSSRVCLDVSGGDVPRGLFVQRKAAAFVRRAIAVWAPVALRAAVEHGVADLCGATRKRCGGAVHVGAACLGDDLFHGTVAVGALGVNRARSRANPSEQPPTSATTTRVFEVVGHVVVDFLHGCCVLLWDVVAEVELPALAVGGVVCPAVRKGVVIDGGRVVAAVINSNRSSCK